MNVGQTIVGNVNLANNRDNSHGAITDKDLLGTNKVLLHLGKRTRESLISISTFKIL